MSKKCLECGGNCLPECGRYPKGCIYGGFIGIFIRITAMNYIGNERRKE